MSNFTTVHNAALGLNASSAAVSAVQTLPAARTARPNGGLASQISLFRFAPEVFQYNHRPSVNPCQGILFGF